MRIYKQEVMLLWIGKELEMVLANPIIVGELCEGDISSEWYINGQLGVMTDGNGLY